MPTSVSSNASHPSAANGGSWRGRERTIPPGLTHDREALHLGVALGPAHPVGAVSQPRRFGVMEGLPSEMFRMAFGMPGAPYECIITRSRNPLQSVYPSVTRPVRVAEGPGGEGRPSARLSRPPRALDQGLLTFLSDPRHRHHQTAQEDSRHICAMCSMARSKSMRLVRRPRPPKAPGVCANGVSVEAFRVQDTACRPTGLWDVRAVVRGKSSIEARDSAILRWAVGGGRWAVRCRNCEGRRGEPLPIGLGTPITNRQEAEMTLLNHRKRAA
jgi:hypothetical protein